SAAEARPRDQCENQIGGDERKGDGAAPCDGHEQPACDQLRQAGADIEERRADRREAVKALILLVPTQAPFQQHRGVIGDIAAMAVADDVDAVVTVVEVANPRCEAIGGALALPGAVGAGPKMRRYVGLDAVGGEALLQAFREGRALLEPLVAGVARRGVAGSVHRNHRYLRLGHPRPSRGREVTSLALRTQRRTRVGKTGRGPLVSAYSCRGLVT